MFSLGRQEEFDDFTTITLNDVTAEQGRKNYMGEGLPENSLNCNACHFNGGVNTDPNCDFSLSGVTPPAFEETNRSFAPRVEELLDQPGDLLAPSALAGAKQLPFDDGFATESNLFNTPTVIEAADTGPFFHSNQVETVEGAVAFYAANRNFRNPEINPQAAAIVPLNGSQIVNIAAFMRVLNADENSRQALELLEFAERLKNRRDISINVRLAISEIEDAMGVLNEGRLHKTDVMALFTEALNSLKKMQKVANWRKKLRVAKTALMEARSTMINRPWTKKIVALQDFHP